MAVFGGLEHVAGEQLAVQDQAAAHAGAHEKAHDIFVSLHSAILVFAQHAHVHVVADVEGHAEFLFDGRFDIIVPPGQVGGKQHDALRLVDDAGRASGDGFDVLLFNIRFLDHLLHHADDDLLDVFGGIAAGLGLFLEPIHGLARFVKNRAQYLGAADVQTNAVIRCHEYTSPCFASRFVFAVSYVTIKRKDWQANPMIFEAYRK